MASLQFMANIYTQYEHLSNHDTKPELAGIHAQYDPISIKLLQFNQLLKMIQDNFREGGFETCPDWAISNPPL
jgi:hypothetical protein